MKSNPGGWWEPFHSITLGTRPRRPSGASKNARPLAHAPANASTWLCSSHAASRRSQWWSETLRITPGRAFSASCGPSMPVMPRPVTISVISVSRSGIGQRVMGVIYTPDPARPTAA